MNDNNWKLMGRQQILDGLHYLNKLNPSSDSTGKGVLLIMQGARFRFGVDTAKYLEQKYNAKGSYSEIADKLGDLYPNKKWQSLMWDFLNDHDPHFAEVEQKVAERKKHERSKEKHSEMRQAFMIRYPHLSTLEADIQKPLIKAGKSFGANQPDKKSPINEVDVRTSNTTMDVFVATVEVRQPKKLLAPKRRQYGKYTVTVNMGNNKFKFDDNGTVADNHSTLKHKHITHKKFKLGGKFQELVNLQPFFAQYLNICQQKYKKFGLA